MEISLKKEFKLLWKFYLFFFLLAASMLIMPFWVIYLVQIGISYFQISIIFGLSLIASLIFEVPTGAIADTLGRKLSVILGLLVAAVCFLLVPMFNTFLSLVLIFFINNAGQTLISGADNAWFVDYLKHKKCSKIIHRAFARMQTFSAAGFVIAFIIGGLFVKQFGIKPLWWVLGGALILVAIYALLFVEEKFERKKVRFRQAMKNTFEGAKSGSKYVRKHPVLFWLVLATFFAAFAGILGLIWQPFLVSVGLPLHYLGYLFAIVASMGIIAPLFSTKLLKIFKTEKRVLIAWQIAGFVFLVLVSQLYNINIILVLYVLFAFFGHMTMPISGAYFQRHIPSETRATIGSLREWVASLGGFIVLIISGYVVDVFGLRTGIIIAAIASIPVIICYLMIKEKRLKRMQLGVKHG